MNSELEFEELLRRAAVRADSIMTGDLPETEDCPHTFSPEFERKMDRLIQKTDHPVKYWSQRVASVLLFLALSAAVWLAGDINVRAAFFDFGKEPYETGYHYFFEGDPRETATEDEYRPSWIPEGYEEWNVHARMNSVTVAYANEQGQLLRFDYTLNSESMDLFIFPEGAVEKTVKIHGMEADYYEDQSGQSASAVIWFDKDRDILFMINGFFSEEELIKIAESVYD